MNADIDRLSNIAESKIISGLGEGEEAVFYSVLDKIEAAIDRQLRGATWSQIFDENSEAAEGFRSEKRGRSR